MDVRESMDASEELSPIPGNKRKGEGGTQQRVKRNRYISIACNECKRRKIKCNGLQPCQRCGNLSLDCVYAPNCCGTNFKDSDEWRQMNAHISSLQEQVNALFASVSSLRSELTPTNPPLDPTLHSAEFMDRPDLGMAALQQAHMMGSDRPPIRTPPAPRAPTFRGPTSNAFSFDVAKSSLHTMGLAPEAPMNEDDGGTANLSPVGSPRLRASKPWMKSHKDPIWFIPQTEALRLVDYYGQETHHMYPILSLDQVRAHITSLYKFLDAFRPAMLRRDAPGSDAIYDDDTILLKLLLAIALTAEGKGRSDLGQRLFQSVQAQVDALLLASAGIKEIRLLAMTAIYEFHCDNESTAWRVIGLTARLSIELGLHRKETYEKMAPEDSEPTNLLFWSIYTLDRRWSFGTGMPFALQDSDIDPQLPKPGDKSKYLSAMVDYCGIGSKVWQAIGSDQGSNVSQTSITRENLKYLDYLIRQWHQNLPDELRFDHRTLDDLRDEPTCTTSTRLKIILYLRLNNMLINIYRPVLHSATNIMSHHPQAQQVVNVAQDSVRTLTRINQTSDVYQTSQILFNAFLTSALAVLFLAVSHAPAAFSAQVRDEVYQALSLVRGFSRGSFVSKRLWKTIKVLKEVGPKLGLDNGGAPPPQDDPSRSAALAMAGLASGGQVDRFVYLPPPPPSSSRNKAWPNTPSSAISTLASPDNMANDLTRLFEAAGEQGGGPPPFPGMVEGGEIGFAGEDDLGKIMRDLF